MAATLDTLRLARRFRDAGVPEPQAEIFADAFREQHEAGFAQLATKADLKADIEALRISTKADLERTAAELRAELHKEMRELAWKMAGLLLAQGAALVALLKLLPGGP